MKVFAQRLAQPLRPRTVIFPRHSRCSHHGNCISTRLQQARPRTEPSHSISSRAFSSLCIRLAPATDSTPAGENFIAAPEINLDTFKPGHTKASSSSSSSSSSTTSTLNPSRAWQEGWGRVVPASPAYFSARPTFTDDFLHLQALLDKYHTLPTVLPQDAPRITWTTLEVYQATINENVRVTRWTRIIELLKRLNTIHPAVKPEEVETTLSRWSKSIQPHNNVAKPIEIDEHGRALAVGRRKTASAKAWVVLGEGQILVNDKPLHQAFERVHDRESVIWPLKITSRLDKYNVYALVTGGGKTGQAEAITLAVAKALMAHEPALKQALRQGGCITRDPRKVERKKPGKLKARKSPTWVKR